MSTQERLELIRRLENLGMFDLIESVPQVETLIFDAENTSTEDLMKACGL